MTPSPMARLSSFDVSDSGTDDTVMSTRLSNCRTASRVVCASRSQSMVSPVAVEVRWRDRFTDARLHTAMLSRSCGKVISVHKLDRWIVPGRPRMRRRLEAGGDGSDLLAGADPGERAEFTGFGRGGVLGVAGAESLAVQLGQVGGFERIEQVPVVVGGDALHELVGNP